MNTILICFVIGFQIATLFVLVRMAQNGNWKNDWSFKGFNSKL